MADPGLTSKPFNRYGTAILKANPNTAATVSLIATAGAVNKIQVLSLAMVSVGANTITFKSNTTAISPDWSLGATGTLVLPYNDNGWFNTAVNEPLQVTLTAATQVGILITYRYITT